MKISFSNFSLRLRLIIIILLAVAPAAALFVYESIKEYEDTYRDSGKNLLYLAELAADSESKVVKGVHDTLTAISEAPFMKSDDLKGCHTYLTQLNRQYRDYNTFALANREGEVICASDRLASPINIRDRPYFEALLREKRFVGAGYLVNRVTGAPVVGFVLPLLRDGEVSGMIATSMRLQAFTSLVHDARLPERATMKVVDSNGIVLASRPDPQEATGKPLASVRIRASLASGTEHLIEARQENGVPALFAVAPALHEGRPVFHVIVGIDKSVIMAPAVRSLATSMMALLSVVILSVFGTWLASRKLLIEPIGGLINAAEEVASGNLKARTKLNYKAGEVGELAFHFDEMAAAIEKREEENLAARKYIEHLALHDELTRLPNRRGLQKHLAEQLMPAKKSSLQIAVLYLDLNRFRVINDSLGYYAGDQLLGSIAERLRGKMRAEDIVARVGGDEFVCAIAGAPQAGEVPRIAASIAECFAEPFSVDNERKVTIRASMGASLFPHDTEDAAVAIKYAEVAMRRAKESGSTVQLFSERMNSDVVRRLRLENELRKALEQNEFVLHYQPQVDLRSNRIVGAEALVRWRHPEQGMISPASFIELAEETRLILALGEWALRTACTQNKAWVKSGLAPIPIAVNVSAHQFKHPGFTELVERALGESGLPAQLLELEITESVLMEDVSSTLEELRKMGITLAIDDFGTGFSGLSYLRDLPVDKLKIDQSFIRNISRMPDNEAITRAIVSIAKSMDLKILAEGVESSETAIFLLRLGCDEGQGYYFGKAVPADEFGPLLQRHARIEYSA